MNENWKPIIGFEGRYEVSNLGRIKSLPKLRGRSISAEKILAPLLTKHGYHRVEITSASEPKKGKAKMVHVLVCEAFIGPRPSDKHMVNHKDSNRVNNTAQNLEWVTALENARHAKAAGRLHAYRGANHPNSKLTNTQVLEIRKLAAEGKNQDEIGALFGVSQTLVNAIHLRRSWKHLK